MARYKLALVMPAVLFLISSHTSAEQAVESPPTGRALAKSEESLEPIGFFPDQSVSALEQIPPDSPRYLESQLRLGQSIWESALQLMDQPEDDSPAPEGVRPGEKKIDALQIQARKVLTNIVTVIEAKAKPGEPLPAAWATAKLTLAQIANQRGEFTTAFQLLETGERPLVSVINLQQDAVRPETGPKSLKFAVEFYQQVLRACVGSNDLDRAAKIPIDMEQVLSGPGQDVLSIYRLLGSQLKVSLNRVATTDRQRYRAATKSLETFLANLLARKDGQNYNSLAWLGAIYTSLGEAVENRPVPVHYFTAGSNAFREIIVQSSKDPKFCTPNQLFEAKLQLAMCQRVTGEFDAAAKLALGLLNERPNSIELQYETALIYQTWGSSGEEHADNFKRWTIAMKGDSASTQNQSKTGMWGWSVLQQKMTNAVDAEKYKQQILEARYYIAFYRYQAGLYERGPKRFRTLEVPFLEIEQIALQNRLDASQYARFNTLFRRIALAVGVPEQDLPRDESRPAPPPKPEL
ncbi:MAG: hypothetical protein JWM11_7920 [Planctomycetaceae bacterium]|nr:hypothetical protein [Planctomycetaceae bacterium]